MTLNNSRYVADGKLEGGWCVSVQNELGFETFKNFEKAKEKFEELTNDHAPTPSFESKRY